MEHVALKRRLQLCSTNSHCQKSTRERAVISEGLECDTIAIVVALRPSIRCAHSVNDVFTVCSIKLFDQTVAIKDVST